MSSEKYYSNVQNARTDLQCLQTGPYARQTEQEMMSVAPGQHLPLHILPAKQGELGGDQRCLRRCRLLQGQLPQKGDKM